MALATEDLGVIGNLAEALGITEGGSFKTDWLADPGKYLSRMLADQSQREALIAFVDEVLGGEDRSTGPDGAVWLPIAKSQPPAVARVFLVLDDRPANYVAIGLAVKVSSTAPVASVAVKVPLFRAAKTGRTVPNALLLGTPEGTATLDVDITTDANTPTPGAAHLGGVALSLCIPTAAGTAPVFALRLRRLQMPGAPAPSDLSLSVQDLASLQASALELVLGLVRAQAAALPAGPLAALAGLLGLRQGSAVTPLPLADLARDGLPALARWLGGVLSSAARSTWLGELSTLLTGVPTNSDGQRVALSIGPLQLSLAVPTAPGANGLVRVEPTLALTWPAQAGVHLQAQAVLCRVDLGNGQATALPSLALQLLLGQAAGGSTLVNLAATATTPALSIATVRAGFGLDATRRPLLVLAADNVNIAGHPHATLDLSTPDAIAQVGATVFSDVADQVFTRLGPAANALRLLLGLAPPSAPAGIVPLDLGRFLQDPLDALRSYWRALLRDHADAVPTLLTTVRDLVADAGGTAIGVTGDGQEATPWRFRLAGPVVLQAFKRGEHLVIGPEVRVVFDNIGQRCTRLETSLLAQWLDIDFGTPAVQFLPSVRASVALRARGHDQAVVPLGSATLTADHVAVVAQWSPPAGLQFDIEAPALTLVGLPGLDPLPVPIPRLNSVGRVVLDAAGWAALEELLGAFARAAAPPWLDDFVGLLGWQARSGLPAGARSARLSLQALAADARAALQAWLADAIVAESQVLQRGLSMLAQLLTGSRAGAGGLLLGRGHPDDPWRLPLARGAASAELLVWMGPDGAPRSLATAADILQSWQPGLAGLASDELARALGQLSRLADDVSDLLAGRDTVAAGFDALIARWQGSDGCSVPPASVPAGVTVHRLPDLAQRDLVQALDLEDLLGAAPATLVHVMVVPSTAGPLPVPWVQLPADRVLDYRAPSLAPTALPLPTPATGEWFVYIGGRDDCRRPTGDEDGVLGQADRLQRLLATLPGPVTVLADAGAGHAARRAAEDTPAVVALVAAGTPLSTLSMAVLDTAPAADALRLLARLLPPLLPDTDDDPDLHLARGLVDALQRELAHDDPARELRPPSAPPASPRAGLQVHMLYGEVSGSAVRRAVTALVGAALRTRSVGRQTGQGLPDRLVLALRARLAPPGSSGALVLSGSADLVLAELRVAAGVFTLVTPRELRLQLDVGRRGGWLVGGPDPGRGAGAPRPHELRRVRWDLRLPLSGGATAASADITLYDARVFGISRERWRLQAADAPAVPRFDASTTLLPEARVLLAGLAQALAGQTDAPSLGLLLLLQSIGFIDANSGSVPSAIEHALNDPLEHLRSAMTPAAARAQLVQGLQALWPGAPALPDSPPEELALALGPLTARVRLNPWRVDLVAAADAGAAGFGWFAWQAALRFDASGISDANLAFGAQAETAITGGLRLELDRALRLALLWSRPGAPSPDRIELWPAPQPAAIEQALVRLLPAEVMRQALVGLRGLDPTAQAVIDGALSLLGLLSPADANGRRRVRLPAALIADPAAWFRHASALGVVSGGFDAARLVQLLDALKPLLGVAGPPGAWELTPGLTVQAQAASGGAVHLALGVNSAAFATPLGASARLALGGSFQLTLPAGAPARPGVEVYVGLAGAVAGRSALHVVVGDHVQVFIRPAAGADIEIFPNAAGLGQMATAAVTQALPLALDALADLSGQPSPKREIGTLVTQMGDAMALRSSGHFQAAALQAWAADPAGQFATRLPVLLGTALQALVNALSGVLPAGSAASLVGSTLHLTAGGLRLDLTPAPFALAVDGVLNAVPVIGHAHARIALDTAGLKEFALDLGPATLDAGGVTLRPAFSVAAGHTPSAGARAALLLGLPASRAVGVRWLIGTRVDLVLMDGATEHLQPDQVALGLLEAVLDMVGSFVLRTQAVSDLLAKRVGATPANTVRKVLTGVLLQNNAPAAPALVPQPFDLALLLARLQQLALNIAEASPSITIDNALTIGLAARDAGGGARLAGLRLTLPKPAVLLNSDVSIALENDARWIRLPGGGAPPEGIVIDMLRVGPAVGAFAFAPGLSVNGVGLRVSRKDKPLLEVDALTLGSIALHVFAQVTATGKAGGAQLQLSGLSVAPAGAGGSGGNGVAQGLLGDAGSGKDRLAPTFSPALAVQKHGANPILVNLRAGDGQGPWWLPIQRGFGPIYVEQVGFGSTEQNNTLQKISILLDGRVSLFGLNAAVDDLQLTHTVASDASVFDPSRWAVDLAGLAFNADMGGLTLQGGLRKFSDGNGTQYVGMLMGRFAVYGLSVFGGYGEGVADGEKFSSFFAFGAVNGPIGGPPAFFLTGIGGGLGINRSLKLPEDMARFDQYPLVKALDPSAKPSSDPMAELIALGGYFPMKRGNFWFAAGVSFTSFALVDGVAVVSVQVGDGVEVALMGLARMALPRPQVALVSIELGLVARFSSKEGVLWVQAQLTDNSWLLYKDVRLTGGFAFVIWFAGTNAGQFVLTIGGYHPKFKRDGYPVVPRLGLQWRVGPFITIKGESYFALTSEALMAGVRVEVSARFGPAWAQVIFGADGIVFFDPFHFQVTAYASISAGVTIDVWIGEITISISISASIMVEGPQFHGIATFSVGPVDLAVEFGETNQPPRPMLEWGAFVRKYLEEIAPDTARAVAALTGKGSVSPGTGPGGATDTATADGSAEKPFEVFAEFEITLTSAVPVARIDLGGTRSIARTPSDAIGVAPMGHGDVDTTLRLDLTRDGVGTTFTDALQASEHLSPSFPYGVWGAPQDPGHPKMPQGKVITALDGLTLSAVADIPPGTDPIDYKRVETAIATAEHPRTRHWLPFVSEQNGRAARLAELRGLAALLPAATDDNSVLATAAAWSRRAGGSRTAAAALRGSRAAPPRLGSLSEDLADAAAPTTPVQLVVAQAPAPVNTGVLHPRAVGVMSLGLDEPERVSTRTTVAEPPPGVPVRVDPPVLADVRARTNPAIPAVLTLVAATRGATQGRTLVAADSAPLTRIARAPVAAVRGRGATRDILERLSALNGVMLRKPRDRSAIPSGAVVAAGEVALYELPNATRDLDEAGNRPQLMVSGFTARVLMLSHGGRLLADVEVRPRPAKGVTALVPVPRGAHRIAVAVGLPAAAQRAGLDGWHSGAMLPLLGHQCALAAQSVVLCEGRQRVVRLRGLPREAGWIRGSELVEGTAIVHTRFARVPAFVAVVLDDPSGTTARRGLSLAIEGASRPVDAQGEPLPPTLVVRGQRVALVYDLLGDAGSSGVTLSVASEDGWHLTGVVAALDGDTRESLVAQLAQTTLDRLVRGPLSSGAGQATVGWLPPAAPQPAPQPEPKTAPGKKRPAKATPTRRQKQTE